MGPHLIFVDVVSQKHENTLLTKPAVWDYAEPRAYLQALYDWRKQTDSKFSYAAWAMELGIKSRSYLRLLLLNKRNLTVEMADQISRNLNISQPEATYFKNLVGLTRAKSLDHKEHYSRELLKLKRKFSLKSQNFVEIQRQDLYDFMSSYCIPRLQVLLTLDGVHKTPDSLAKLLNRSLAEVEADLATLKKLGLADLNKEGQWIALENRIETHDFLGHIALQSFHKKSLEEAIRGLDLPKNERRYQSLVLCLTQNEMEKIHAEIGQMFQDILKRYENTPKTEAKVYQINLNLIPVTRSIVRASQTHAPTESSTDLHTVKEDSL